MDKKLFPTLCIDDFYSCPDKIREFANLQDYYPNQNGIYPGVRTKELHLIDEEFFSNFCQKLFSIFYDFSKSCVNWSVSTQFHKLTTLDVDSCSIKNKGWIHYDENSILAGVIYLNKNFENLSGTSLFECIDKDTTNSKFVKWNDVKKLFYTENIDSDYDFHLKENHSCFIETARFSNHYNRFLCYDSSIPHRFDSCYNVDEPRLTQVFFVKNLNTDSGTPIVRMKNYL
jgi:hypothetical protein